MGKKLINELIFSKYLKGKKIIVKRIILWKINVLFKCYIKFRNELDCLMEFIFFM